MAKIKNEIEEYVKSRSRIRKSQDPEEYQKYKVLLLGDASVGKTCIMRTLMGREFKPKLPSTVGK